MTVDITRRCWSLVTSRGLPRALAFVVSLVLVVGGLVGGAAAPAAASGVTISGGGSSFAAPEIQQWTADVARPPADLTVNYAVSSSGGGRDGYAEGEDQYAASDNVYYSQDGGDQQQAVSRHPFKYVTVTAGGLAFMYNVVIDGQLWRGLNLTDQAACEIFTGQLSTWNQLASIPGDAVLAGVTERITPVVRSDEAGESYVLSQFCESVDPQDWAKFQQYVQANQKAEDGVGWQGDTGMAMGTPIENWPPELEDQASGNAEYASGALAEVNDVEDPNSGGYAIGYMAAVYALTAGYPMASMENSAGRFVQPNATSVNIALSYATANNLGTFNLAFTGGNPGAYFPSTYSYVIAPITTNAPTSAGADATLAQFLCYAVGAGQNEAAPELYAPLSAEVTALSVGAIESIPGAPPANQCGQGGPAPVVTPGSVGGTNPGSASPGSGSGSTGPGSDSNGASTAGGADSGATATTVAGAQGATTTTVGVSTAGSGSSPTVTAGSSLVAGLKRRSGAAALAGDSSASSPTSVLQASPASSTSTTNSEAYWYLLLGAIVCGVGVLAVGARRGTLR